MSCAYDTPLTGNHGIIQLHELPAIWAAGSLNRPQVDAYRLLEFAPRHTHRDTRQILSTSTRRLDEDHLRTKA